MQDGALLCEKIRALCPAVPQLFTVKSDDAAAALMRDFSLHELMRCTQWVYEKSDPPCPVTADIRPLTQEHAALAASVYHDDGSMGMLEILPPFRRRGYAAQLEAFLIAAALSDGRTPYCHVVDGNEASLRLQQKMGLICTRLPAIWVN